MYTEACEASEQGGNTPICWATELAAKKNLSEPAIIIIKVPNKADWQTEQADPENRAGRTAEPTREKINDGEENGGQENPARSIPSNWALAIRDSRVRHGSTQFDASARAGFSQNYWSEVERGKYVPGLQRMAGLASAVGKAPALDWIRISYT